MSAFKIDTCTPEFLFLQAWATCTLNRYNIYSNKWLEMSWTLWIICFNHVTINGPHELLEIFFEIVAWQNCETFKPREAVTFHIGQHSWTTSKEGIADADECQTAKTLATYPGPRVEGSRLLSRHTKWWGHTFWCLCVRPCSSFPIDGVFIWEISSKFAYILSSGMSPMGLLMWTKSVYFNLEKWFLAYYSFTFYDNWTKISQICLTPKDRHYGLWRLWVNRPW